MSFFLLSYRYDMLYFCDVFARTLTVTIKENKMNNLIAFFEIPTVDFYRAIDFYETILGLKIIGFRM